MKRKIHKLFPTPVYVIENFLTKKQCEDVLGIIINNTETYPHGMITGDGGSTHGSRDNSLQQIQQNVESCFDIQSRIQTEIDLFTDNCGYFPAGIHNSWVNVVHNNSELLRHSHSMSRISGALYLETDKESYGLDFYNPNPFRAANDTVRMSEYTSDKKTFDVNNGKLIIFPSWLEHSSSCINASERRVVLSFNTK